MKIKLAILFSFVCLFANAQTVLPVKQGGTGITSYTAGDLIKATGTTTLSKLGIGSSGQVLTVSGGAPTWATPAASTFTINGTSMSTGNAYTVTAAAGTLTGTSLNSTVVTSSLTSVGTVTAGVISTTVTAIASQSLTIAAGGTTTVNGYNNKGQTLYTTSTATATTIAYSNIPDGNSVTIDYQKTTASNMTFTFPSGTVVCQAGSAAPVSTYVWVVASTTSGRFTITIQNINGTYKVYITQDVL